MLVVALRQRIATRLCPGSEVHPLRHAASRNWKRARTMHAELLEKAQQLSISSAAPNTDLRIVSAALPPARPYTPNYPLNLILGLFTGLFAGVLFAVSREQVRPRLRAPGDSSLLLQLPELAAIPCIDRRRDAQYLLAPPMASRLENRLELAAWNGTSGPLIESIHDALRVNYGQLRSRLPGHSVHQPVTRRDGKTLRSPRISPFRSRCAAAKCF